MCHAPSFVLKGPQHLLTTWHITHGSWKSLPLLIDIDYIWSLDMPIMSLSLALTILNVDPRTKQLAEVGIMLNKDTSMRESGYRGRIGIGVVYMRHVSKVINVHIQIQIWQVICEFNLSSSIWENISSCVLTLNSTNSTLMVERFLIRIC